MDATDTEITEAPRGRLGTDVTSEIEGNTETIIYGKEISRANRSFTVKNLKQPGGWKTNAELQRILDICEECEIKFNKTDLTKKLKVGRAFCLFSTVPEAQKAYTNLSAAKIDGQPFEIEISENFVIPGEDDFFKPSQVEQLRKRTIYALNLVFATKEFLETIFGQDTIEAVKFLPQEGDKKQAEVVMSSHEEATSAKQDANVFDDEDPSSSMKVLTPEEYVIFVQESRNKGKVHPPPAEDKAIQDNKENEQVELTPEIEEEDVIEAMNTQVEEDKLNWAELTEIEELYQICDKVSSQFGGLPDSILKPAMLSTLNRHHAETDSHWMREHLQGLSQIWRRETEREVPFVRETQVIMKAAKYEPVLVSNTRKRKAKGSKAGRVMMGVGALLQATKRMRTENGEVEIDEDESGNIMLNGEELSFDNWAKCTRSNQPDVVVMEAPQNKEKPQPQMNGKKKKDQEYLSFDDYKKYKKQQYEKRMGNKKMRIMDRARREMEAFENEERAASTATVAAAVIEPEDVPDKPPSPEKVPKELDEGEIDSEEERQMDKNKKKKKKTDSDSSSSSSEESETDSGEAANNARGRRALLRKAKLKKAAAANPLGAPILQQLFDFRHQVVKLLPLDQKQNLVRYLRDAMERGSSQDPNYYRQFSDDLTRLSY